MKTIVTALLAVVPFFYVSNSFALDKSERKEILDCSKMAYLIDSYGMEEFVNTSDWYEIKELYYAEMSPLEIKKLEKSLDKEIRKMDSLMRKIKNHKDAAELREEHLKYFLFAYFLSEDKTRNVLYNCF